MLFKRYKIQSYEVGLLFRDGEFAGLLDGGVHRYFDPLNRIAVDVMSVRDPWIAHEKLDIVVKSGVLENRAVVLDLKDHERALVWLDNRFSHVLPAGLYACWTGHKEVRVEIVDARQTQLQHPELRVIARSAQVQQVMDVKSVSRECAGVLFVDGKYVDTLTPGQYAFWKAPSAVSVVDVDVRETVVDVSGQEIMTADKVTLRLNAVVTYRVSDAKQSVTQTDDVRQSLYRETQLVLRALVGTRDLDDFLGDKDAVASEVEEGVRRRAAALGLTIASVGIRDVILPGEMKVLMNRVTEARKAAEANLIFRREETAAIRSQSNTAKLLADSPMLMRLRELEVLEKVASAGKLNIVLGERGENEKGLVDKVAGLL